jgi:hypothetical protein
MRLKDPTQSKEGEKRLKNDNISKENMASQTEKYEF